MEALSRARFVKRTAPAVAFGIACCLAAGSTFAASPPIAFLSEILFNPPGTDSPNEYIELRGTPNSTLPPGTYLVSVEGDAGSNPGTVQDIFDLSGRSFGGNGFLVLLQKGSPYVPHPFSRTYTQSGGDPGWGHGGNSSLKHRGEAGATDIENPSLTFFLIQSSISPSIGDDIDSNDDGLPDGELFAAWTVLDSVGVLDADGAGDIAYGAVNFRRSAPPGSLATAGGTVIPVGFTPVYVARNGNSTGAAAADWVASEALGGTPPSLTLGEGGHTYPASLAGSPLNHLGASNFGAPGAAGVVLDTTGLPASPVPESGSTNSFTLQLTRPPAGQVVIQWLADPGLEVSVNGGVSFSSAALLPVSTAAVFPILVRTVDNQTVEPSPRSLGVRGRVLVTADPAFSGALIPVVNLSVADNDPLLLNEVNVNPVGPDEGREFIELRGHPGASLNGVLLLAVESDTSGNLGTVVLLLNLTSQRLGDNGLLFIAAPGHPYAVEPATAQFLEPRFLLPGGLLPNGSLSILLLSTAGVIEEGEDLDPGGSGELTGLPHDATLLDSIAWLHGGGKNQAYGALLSVDGNSVPDAATRFPGDGRPNTVDAWFFGDLRQNDPSGLQYDRQASSANLPQSAVLTPGGLNNTPPAISRIDPISGAVGDPTNPSVTFTLSDAESPADRLVVWATSTNQLVLHDDHITLTPLGGGSWALSMAPVGVGYSLVQVTASDGLLTNQVSFRYAASNDGTPRTRFMIGAGDGSTAIPLPGNRLLIGDDENQVIRLYDRDRSSLPLVQYNFTPLLGLTDVENGIPREVDIEGSTRAGDRIFWLGAHSHASNAESRTNRSRIFATDLLGDPGAPSLQYVGRYDYLKLDLVDWDHRNLHGKGVDYYGLMASTQPGVDPKAVDGSGFNLEGLAMAPGGGETAYVACRAPLAPAGSRVYALIIPVLNFTSLAGGNGPPGSAQFGMPIEMDLFGRGIRSIEGVGSNYLIIAGPPAPAVTNYPNDFRLYTWTGNPADAPQLRSTRLTGLNPEGIVELPLLPWSADREVQLLSDCGTRIWYGDGVITKELPEVNFKKCRLDWVSMGEVVLPEPVILGVDPEGSLLRIRWRGATGGRYRLQTTDDPASAAWSDLPGDITTRFPINTSRVAAGDQPHRFFRIMMLP